jgi:hypothetical protein
MLVTGSLGSELVFIGMDIAKEKESILGRLSGCVV